MVKFHREAIPDKVNASGYVEVPPQNHVRISPFISGNVSEIYFLEGQKVNKGQPLIKIKSQEGIDLQETFLELINRVKYLENEYNRQKTLS